MKHPKTVAMERYRQRRRLNGGKPLMVPAAKALALVNELRAAGMTQKSIARRAGVHHQTVESLCQGRRLYVEQATYVALRRVAANDEDSFYVNSAGTQRRLQALQWMGWTWREIDRARGVAYCTTQKILRQDRVTRPIAIEIAELYEQYSRQPPLPVTKPEKGAVTQAKRRAQRNRWAPPAAWDDIDDPNEKPKGLRKAA